MCQKQFSEGESCVLSNSVTLQLGQVSKEVSAIKGKVESSMSSKSARSMKTSKQQ